MDTLFGSTESTIGTVFGAVGAFWFVLIFLIFIAIVAYFIIMKIKEKRRLSGMSGAVYVDISD
jgi:hypothetical protein